MQWEITWRLFGPYIYIYIIYTYIQPHKGDARHPARMMAQWCTYIYYKEGDCFPLTHKMRMQITAVIPRNSFVLNAGSSQTSVQHVAPLKIPPTNNSLSSSNLPVATPAQGSNQCLNCDSTTRWNDTNKHVAAAKSRQYWASGANGRLPCSQQDSQEGNRCTASPHSTKAPPTSPCHLPHDSTSPEKE